MGDPRLTEFDGCGAISHYTYRSEIRLSAHESSAQTFMCRTTRRTRGCFDFEKLPTVAPSTSGRLTDTQTANRPVSVGALCTITQKLQERLGLKLKRSGQTVSCWRAWSGQATASRGGSNSASGYHCGSYDVPRTVNSDQRASKERSKSGQRTFKASKRKPRCCGTSCALVESSRSRVASRR